MVGLRKPDPRIYEHACRCLGIEAREAVFLDDIGSNLKAARALGMTTIKVDSTRAGAGRARGGARLRLCAIDPRGDPSG